MGLLHWEKKKTHFHLPIPSSILMVDAMLWKGLSLQSISQTHCSYWWTMIFAFTEFSAYLCLPVMYKGTYSSNSVSVGHANQSTTALWTWYCQVNCHYRVDRSICTIGTQWTKIRPAARYCMGSELQPRMAACVTNAGRYRQLQTKLFKASSQYPLEQDGLKCCYQGTHLDIQNSSLPSYSRAFGWQHCLRRAMCGIDSREPDLSVLSQPR